VYDDFPIADESPDARCSVAIGIKVAKEDHFGHSSFIQRRAAYWGNREETLREAKFSLRAGLRDLSAYLRQDRPHLAHVRYQFEGVMKRVVSAPADAAAVKCELAGEVLRSFGGLRFAATGWSMLPTIWPGDTLVVERAGADQLQVGEVALVGRDGRLCAHRVVSRAKAYGRLHWVTQGDAMPVPDRPITETELLGRVAYLVRAGKRIPMRAELSVIEHLIAKMVRRSFLAARVFVYLHDRVRNSGKSGLKESNLPCQG
jgi:hypothetical protein